MLLHKWYLYEMSWQSHSTCPREPKKLPLREAVQGGVPLLLNRACSSWTSTSVRVTDSRSVAGMWCFGALGFILSRQCSVLHPVHEDVVTSSPSDRIQMSPERAFCAKLNSSQRDFAFTIMKQGLCVLRSDSIIQEHYFCCAGMNG